MSETLLIFNLQVHCMALIKNALMCQADTTLLTMRWLDFSPIPAANWSTPRTCVDWSRIDDWTKNNWVDAKKDGRMVHPKFGKLRCAARVVCAVAL